MVAPQSPLSTRVAVNWETGQLTFGILSIYFPFVVLGSHIPYGSWTIGVCIPLGAMLFLRQQKKLRISGESIPLLVEGGHAHFSKPAAKPHLPSRTSTVPTPVEETIKDTGSAS